MRFLLKPLLSLVVVLVLLGAAEVTVRLFFSEPLKSKNIHSEAEHLYAGAGMLESVEEDGVRYRGRPGTHVEIKGVPYQHNSLGLRGPELDSGPRSERFRILLLGDSNAYGWGVKYEQSFGYLMQELLNARHASSRRVEVVNAAFVGYNSGDAEALYRTLEGTVQPDLVLLAWYANDLDRLGFHVDLDGHLFCDPLSLPDSWKPYFWVSRIYRNFSVWAFDRMKRRGVYIFGEGENLTYSEKKLTALHDEVARAGREFALLELPTLLPSPGGNRVKKEGYVSRKESAWLERVTSAHGITMLDLMPAVQERGVAAYWVQLDPVDTHPNPRAHEKYAEAIVEFLLARKLVPVGE